MPARLIGLSVGQLFFPKKKPFIDIHRLYSAVTAVNVLLNVSHAPEEGDPEPSNGPVEHDEDVEECCRHPRRHVVRHVQDQVEHLAWWVGRVMGLIGHRIRRSVQAISLACCRGCGGKYCVH